MKPLASCVLLLLAVGSHLSACSRSCKDADRIYDEGETWTCSDGCNYCSCHDGDVVSTAIGCSKPPGANANKRDCNGPAGRAMRHGSQWTCDENMCCECADGAVERAAGACPDA